MTLLIPTRGERNNNLGNINFEADPHKAWDGQIGLEIVPAGEHYTPRFGRYDTMLHGLRAMARQLIIDNTRHGLMTIATIIGDDEWGWAPAADRNDPDAYAATVSRISGIPADKVVELRDLNTLLAVMPGFITEENGRCLVGADLLQAAALAAINA